VHVSVPTLQVHPVPLIAVAVRRAGSVLVTVIVPAVEPAPAFDTVIV